MLSPDRPDELIAVLRDLHHEARRIALAALVIVALNVTALILSVILAIVTFVVLD